MSLNCLLIFFFLFLDKIRNIMSNYYRYCIVPGCLSTSLKTTNKRFLTVPKDEARREAWIRAVRSKTQYSKKASIYVCEDHFNVMLRGNNDKLLSFLAEFLDFIQLEEDAENWLKVKLGGSKILTLKKTVVPHIFQCQPSRSNAQPVKEWPAAVKRVRRSLVQGLLSSPLTAGTLSTCSILGSTTQTALKVPSQKKSEDPTLIVTPAKNQLNQFPSPFEESSVETTYETGKQQQSSPLHWNISPQKRVAAEALCELFNKQTLYLHNTRAASGEQRESGCNDEGLVSDNALNLLKSKKSIEDRSKGVRTRPSIRSKEVQCQRSPKGKFKSIAIPPIKLPKNQVAQSEDIQTSSVSTEESSNSTYKRSTDASSSDEQQHVKKLPFRQAHLGRVKRDPMHYIGVPSEYYYLIPVLAESVLSSVLNVLICLQKIRLNQSFKGLAYDYEVSESFCSKVFGRVVPSLAECLSSLIIWPDRLTIKRKIPLYFYECYHDVQSIIDCFEIEIAKPSDPINQSLTWSNYAKCSTQKYCISCTSNGLINYVSGGFGGRSSDVKIVESRGYLDVLPDGVSVMADRGFKGVATLLAKKNCKLVRPFSVSSSELSTREHVRASKKIASLRIQVERVIRRIREFSFLKPHACVNSSLCKYTDCVVEIVCGLVNLQKSLISKFA